eukprot:1159202-Pelagomonas_calceolata.AAC.1
MEQASSNCAMQAGPPQGQHLGSGPARLQKLQHAMMIRAAAFVLYKQSRGRRLGSITLSTCTQGVQRKVADQLAAQKNLRGMFAGSGKCGTVWQKMLTTMGSQAIS